MEKSFYRLNLTIPLYDQGISSVAAQKGLAQRRLTEAVLMSTRTQIRNNLRVLLNQIDTDEQILKITKELKDKATQTYEAMVALFEFGKTTYLNVSLAETNLNNAETQLVTLQLQLAGEKAKLEAYGNYSEGKRLVNRNKCPIALGSARK